MFISARDATKYVKTCHERKRRSNLNKEKEEYTSQGIHIGMEGVVLSRIEDRCLVNFEKCGDLAEETAIGVSEQDLEITDWK